MKNFILTVFNGVKIIFVSIFTIVLCGAGIYTFCQVSTLNGFSAVGEFILGILQLFCGVLLLYMLGDTFKRGNNND